MRVWNCPVLPVMPCVMTRVFLSIRMLMSVPGSLQRGHHGLGSIGHRVGTDDRQTRVGQQLLAELLVRPLHPHDQRHGQVGGLAGGDHALGDGVAAHDAAEDVDQDRRHLLVRSMILKASVTFSAEAPPPTSRKLAGSPPNSLIVSMVAIASPAPF